MPFLTDFGRSYSEEPLLRRKNVNNKTKLVEIGTPIPPIDDPLSIAQFGIQVNEPTDGNLIVLSGFINVRETGITNTTIYFILSRQLAPIDQSEPEILFIYYYDMVITEKSETPFSITLSINDSDGGIPAGYYAYTLQVCREDYDLSSAVPEVFGKFSFSGISYSK